MPSKTTHKPKSDAFGVDADPVEFDLEDWLSGATMPSRSVKIYRDAAARARYDELEQQFILLGAKIGSEDDDHSDRTLDEADPRTRQYEIAEQMQALIERTEADTVQVRVRSLTPDEWDKLRKRKSEDEDVLYREIFAVTGRIVHGGQEAAAMSSPKWKAFQTAIGPKQWKKLIEASDDANGFTSSQVMPDFSPAASALLATKES